MGLDHISTLWKCESFLTEECVEKSIQSDLQRLGSRQKGRPVMSFRNNPQNNLSSGVQGNGPMRVPE